MRVLVFSYEYPPVGGGGSDVVHHVARELARRGHAVRVITAHCAGLSLSEQVDGYDVRRIRCFRRRPGGCTIPEMFAYVAMACLRGIGECRRFRPDVIHIHHAMPDGPIGWWLRILFRKPYVMTAHGGDVPGFIPALDGFFRRIAWVNRRVWNRASANVACAEHLARSARRHFPQARIICIPNGVDVEKFAPPESRDPSSVGILFAGRFHWQKNVETLIRAAHVARSLTDHPFRLILCGSGPDEKDLRALADELGLGGIVEFRGWIDRGAMAEAMREADIFALPSLIEGMPVACAQAMASGLPVVATNVPGTSEEVVDGVTGCLVPTRDPDAMGRALADLVASPEKREAMGRAGRQRSEDVFTWDKIGEAYEQILRDAVRNR